MYWSKLVFLSYPFRESKFERESRVKPYFIKKQKKITGAFPLLVP
jgi:hypothetical protein